MEEMVKRHRFGKVTAQFSKPLATFSKFSVSPANQGLRSLGVNCISWSNQNKSNPATTEPVLVDEAKVTTSPVGRISVTGITKKETQQLAISLLQFVHDVRREWQHQEPTVSP